MLIEDFIPLIHLESYRVDFSELNDPLFVELRSNNSDKDECLSGREEYQKIINFKSKEVYQNIQNKPQKDILLELLAGSLSLSLKEKEIIIEQVVNGLWPEKNQFNLIDMLIDDRNKFFDMYMNMDDFG